MPRINEDSEIRRVRTQMIDLLRSPPRLPVHPGKRIDQALWDRADEHERRQMLRDCGWL